MIYTYLYPLADHWIILNVLRYITFRSFMAFVTSLVISLVIGPKVIRFLGSLQWGQMVREDGPKSHLQKQGTPTMGGVLIIASSLFSILLWADLSNPYIWICIATFIIYGTIGFIDDYLKVAKKNAKGLRGKYKILLQSIFGIILGYFILQISGNDNLYFPFFKNAEIQLDYLYPLFVALVIVASSNAVNLTDGLDGLAIGPIVVVSFTFAIFAYVAGNEVFSQYLIMPYIKFSGETTIVAVSLCASGLGFLWFNSYPAQVFMGDTGSLSLGAVVGIFAVITKNELLLIILGGVFVMEAFSVITQVFFFKTTGKRVFRMAPIHHHFELKGWPEPKVIVRFWILSILLAVLSIATLKLR